MKSLALLTFIICCTASNNYTVKYAAVIYRHGDRTPVDPYPTDPWSNESLWPAKFGELTNLGKLQHFVLGLWLRDRYLDLISGEYDPTVIQIRSTDVDRTLMSAQANLAGMFPPDVHSTWNPNLLWQPIPVHTVPEHDDELLAMKKECKLYTRLRQSYIESKSYNTRLDQYQDLMDYLTVNTGKEINDYVGINSIYSTLKIESFYNFTLPFWTQRVFPDKMKEPACYSFSVATATPKMARMMIGPLLKKITEQAQDVAYGKSKLKLSIYSGHDFTIGNILNGLGLYDGNCPVYTATILFEVLEQDGNYFVKLSYRNSTDIVEPFVLNIPQCGPICPLEDFIQLYQYIVSVNWDNECQDTFQFWLIVIVSGLIFICVIQYAAKVAIDKYTDALINAMLAHILKDKVMS